MGIKINAVYGTEDTFYQIQSGSTYYPVKLATLANDYSMKYFNHALGTGIDKGLFTDIDISVCPIAVASDAGLSDVTYFARYKDDDNVIQVYKYEADKLQCPVMFVLHWGGINTGVESILSANDTDVGGNCSWDSGNRGSSLTPIKDYPSVMSSYSCPIVSFDYKKIMLAIVVHACDGLTSEGVPNSNNRFYDLNSYIKTGYKTHNIVVGLGVAYYTINSEKTESGQKFVSNNFSISPQDYKFTSDISRFTFYAMPVGSNANYKDRHGNIKKYYGGCHSTNNQQIYYGDTGEKTTRGTVTMFAGVPSSYSSVYTYTTDTDICVVYNASWFKSEKIISGSSISKIYHWTESPDLMSLRDYCLKQAAYFGMYYSDNINDLLNTATPDIYSINSTHLGLIDSNGVTNGNYASGSDIKKHEQSEWDSLKNQSPYDYTKEPDPSKYDDATKLNTGKIFTVGSNVFTNTYAMSRIEVIDLSKYLYSVIAPESTSETNVKQFLTNNPIDCIVSCMQYPFDVGKYSAKTSSVIRLGNTDAKTITGVDVKGYPISNSVGLLDFGAVRYFPFYKDFRDYEPYSDALLYIPYVGYIPVSPSEFMNSHIGVKMIVDLITGACTALIYRNDLVIQAVDGTIGLQVPVTGIQQSDYANAQHNASNQLKMALATTIGGIVGNTVSGVASGVTGKPEGVASAITSIATGAVTGSITTENAQYNLEHTRIPFKISGTASTACGFLNEQECRLILKRPVMDANYNAEIYGSTVGFACCIQGKISRFSGYSQFCAVRLQTTATADEKNMIIEALEGGVIL